ncbi:MAG: DUF167 domain-containing protein [Verrucomicrobia bacterium]|nr:DUF167 domain-containing protein [Verrucomicrobiota bacterium]
MPILATVRVIPNASRTQSGGWQDDILRVRLNAPPIEGKANKALLEFLADPLGLRARDFVILSGETSRIKRLAIHGAPEDWSERLNTT